MSARRLWRCCVTPMIGLAMAGLAGCAAPPDAVTPSATDRLAITGTISVIDRGWHTDIAVPAEQIGGLVAALGLQRADLRFVVFGFGDRAYLTATHQNIFDMVAALFPGPGVILVTALSAPPQDAFGADHVVTIAVTEWQMARLAGFLRKNLASDGNVPRALGDGPYPGSVFYSTGTRYDALHNCNGWTLQALRSAGLTERNDPALFAFQVSGEARNIVDEKNSVNNEGLAEVFNH